MKRLAVLMGLLSLGLVIPASNTFARGFPPNARKACVTGKMKTEGRYVILPAAAFDRMRTAGVVCPRAWRLTGPGKCRCIVKDPRATPTPTPKPTLTPKPTEVPKEDPK